jgi:signal transduction histidine kinase
VPSLFVIYGRDQGNRFELDEQLVTIGRVSNNTIQLHDTEVSRTHAQLRQQEEGYFLRDLDSSNGTFVNGRRLVEHELSSGDQLQLGSTVLLYTGVTGSHFEDLADKINIVAPHSESEGSRIVHTVTQSEGSQLLGPISDESVSPWLARARSNLEIMYRTALAVSHTLDIDELLARIMDMIFEWVDADRGCIMLKDEESGDLIPKVRRHRRSLKSDDRITISKTILDYVVDHNEGVLTSDAREDDRWDPAQSIVKLGVREAICVPMQGRYHVVGAIYIDTSVKPEKLLQQGDSNQFTQEHLKLMIAIAHQAALAVEDTSYYKAMVQAERLAAVGQTIATLSHHIKNILQGVRGGSYLIEVGLKDHASALKESQVDLEAAEQSIETMRKGWGIVEKNQERISTLVMDMLTFSKDREPEPEPANLNDVVSDVVELVQVRAGNERVYLSWKADPEMPVLLFDPEGMHRAILNVVSNAVDACQDLGESRVDIETRYDPAQAMAFIRVADNGSGIEKNDLEKIFTVFVSHKGGRGTGLGLPVSQKILQEHSGQIRVESNTGAGSIFTLELPATTPPLQDAEDDSAAAANSVEKSKLHSPPMPGASPR